MIATRGAGVTAAAGTGLTHHLFAKIFTLGKAYTVYKHLEFPCHTFVHCRVFAPAAPRRARTSISVSFSGQPLSRPLRIFGLVSLYLANNLIRRQLILRPDVSEKEFFHYQPHIRHYPQFPKVIPDLRADY